jgi:hypothetical protein
LISAVHTLALRLSAAQIVMASMQSGVTFSFAQDIQPRKSRNPPFIAGRVANVYVRFGELSPLA